MENPKVADILDEIADLIELQGGNEFRVRAYRSAAGTVRRLPDRLVDLIERGEDLTEIPDVGERMAEEIHEILERGTCQRLEDLRARVPEELTELLQVPRLGPKTVMRLHEELGVTTLDDLREAAETRRIRALNGIGERTEATILDGVESVASGIDRLLLQDAERYAANLGRYLDGISAIDRWVIAGSYRRRKETVGDLDVVVRTSDRDEAADGIASYGEVVRVLERGEEGLTVRLEGGLQVDVRFFEEAGFGAALLYFTGSKEHTVALRRIALERDWKLNEYGLFKGDRRLAGSDEASVYHRLNLAWVPPELREHRGEIEAAANDALPQLITLDRIRGDLHAHTDASDGRAGIREMADAARERGYEYLAITDHSKRVTIARGLDDDAALAHADAIRAVDAELDDLLLLAGIEVDILRDGSLDLKQETLRALDWVIASIHDDLDLTSEAMTDRLLAAVESGVVHCLGHPTARRLGRREGVAFDADRVFAACAEHGVLLEINAQPDRLDLPDVSCKRAKEAGVRFVISTDAHRPADLDLMRLGVDVARRGWLEPRDVLTTSTAGRLREALALG